MFSNEKYKFPFLALSASFSCTKDSSLSALPHSLSKKFHLACALPLRGCNAGIQQSPLAVQAARGLM
ncbi:MAG: hypothetical protein DBX51_07115 [Clostridiales bacterium]|nr:MAG: hypothetical protein DBX51_07115 [Clostridiales bacterium]